MNEDQEKQKDLIDTTDCLEAVGVFRGWKNFLFVIAICCLLLLQGSFWLVDTGYVETDDDAKSESPAVVAEAPDLISEAAKQAAAEPNQSIEAAPQQPQKASPGFSIKLGHLAWLIRFLDFVLILTAILYCLTMLFSLKVSMLGRLGGINHICRAFFLSLTFVVLLLPWQRFFAGVVSGAMYTPDELLSSCAAVDNSKVFEAALHYLRFTGYWLVVMLLLVFSHLRSARWAKAILRRLEVM